MDCHYSHVPSLSASLVKSYNGLTGIRAQNIHSGLKRIPAGFYVLVQFDGTQRRTQNKSIRLSDSGIEWEDEILLLVDRILFAYGS